VPQGQVVSTDPVAGQQIAAGTKVNLNVSNGQVTVPNVVNLDVATAQARLTAPDVLLTVSLQYASACTNGSNGTTVLQQSILPGLTAQGSTIVLTIGCN
jgi:serine/threonine-protein kinase